MNAKTRLPDFDLAALQCRSRWPQQHPRGRRCTVCDTPLSRYNPDETCFQHRPEPPLEYCGHRFKLCSECGCVMLMRSKADTGAGTCHECREVTP